MESEQHSIRLDPSSLPPIPPVPSLLILGKNRSGKTTLSERILKTYQQQNKRLISVVSSPRHLSEFGPIVTLKFLLTERRWPKQFRILIDFHELDSLCKFMLVSVTDCVLYVDDADAYMRNKVANIFRLARMGRHRGIGFVFCSGRPQGIPRDFRDIGDENAIFHSTDKSVLDWCTEQDYQLASEVRTLDQYEYAWHVRSVGQTTLCGGKR